MISESPSRTVLFSTVLAVLAIAIMVWVPSVGADVWKVDQTEDLEIGPEEKQVVSGIGISSDSKSVKINVGELVAAGANLSPNSSSYDIKNGQSAETDEVWIKSPNTTDATIVIEESALSIDSSGEFDLVIYNINSTEISLNTETGSFTDSGISYQITQDTLTAESTFQIVSNSNIDFASYDGIKNNVDVTNVSLENKSSDYIVIWQVDEAGQLDRVIGQSEGTAGNLSINVDSIENDSELAATIHPGSDTPDYSTIYSIDRKQISVPIQLTVNKTPVHYISTTTSTNDTNESIVEILFNSEIQENGSVEIAFNNSDSVKIDLGGTNEVYSHTNGRLRLYTSELDTATNHSRLSYINSITLKNISAKKEAYPIDLKTYDAKHISKTVSSGSNRTIAYRDQIGFESATNDNFTISIDRDGDNKSISSTLDSRIISYDSQKLATGSYTISSESFESNSQINIKNLNLKPELMPDDIWTNDTISMRVNSNIDNRNVKIKINNENGSAILDRRVYTGKDGVNTSLIFQDAGNHTIILTDISTNDSFTSEIQVNELNSPSLNSTKNKVRNGGIFDLDLRANQATNTTSLTVINETNTTVATATVTSPRSEPVTIRLNTYAAGETDLENALLTAADPATVESVESNVDGPLPPGEYTVTATANPDGSSESATTTLEPRSTTDLTVYTTTMPTDALADADTVERAIANGSITPAENVTEGETVVYAVDATGLPGFLAARNATLESGSDLDRLDGLAFAVSVDSGNETVATAAGSTVASHDGGLFVTANATETLADAATPGASLTASFEVVDDRLRNATDADDHSVSAPLTYVVPDETGDGDVVETADADQETVDTGDDGGSSSGSRGAGDDGSTPEPGPPDPDGPDNADPERGDPERGDSEGSDTSESTENDAEDARQSGPPARVVVGPHAVANLTETRERSPSADTAGGSDPTAVDTTAFGDATRDPDDRMTATEDGESTESDAGDPTDASAAEPNGSEPTGGASNRGNRSARPPGFDEAPIRSTAYDVPGFGVNTALAALALAGGAAARRRAE